MENKDNFEKQVSLCVLDSLEDLKEFQNHYPEFCENIFFKSAIARLCLIKDNDGGYMLSKYDNKN